MINVIKKNAWTRVILLIVPYFIIVGFFQLIGYYFAGVDYKTPTSNKTIDQQLIITFLTFIGTFLVLFIFMKFLEKENFRKIGFSNDKKNDLNKGALLGFIIISFSFVILLSFREIVLLNINFNIKSLFFSFLTCIIVSITEESLLRGYVLRNFLYSFKQPVAIVLSSLLFAIMHLANPNMNWLTFLNIFLGGIFLGIYYIKMKNLWFPIGLHFSWNFFQTIYGFNVSGINLYSLIEIKLINNSIINGGNFGLEGSIIVTLIQIVIITYAFLKLRLQQY